MKRRSTLRGKLLAVSLVLGVCVAVVAVRALISENDVGAPTPASVSVAVEAESFAPEPKTSHLSENSLEENRGQPDDSVGHGSPGAPPEAVPPGSGAEIGLQVVRSAHESEVRDPVWADATERLLLESGSSEISNRSAHCRTTLCSISFDAKSNDAGFDHVVALGALEELSGATFTVKATRGPDVVQHQAFMVRPGFVLPLPSGPEGL